LKYNQLYTIKSIFTSFDETHYKTINSDSINYITINSEAIVENPLKIYERNEEETDGFEL
jgi:hypothetical protein